MSQETRIAALDAASRACSVTGASSTGDVLSSARMFDKYLTTGITRYGKHSDRVQLDVAGKVHVIIDGDALHPEQVTRMKAAIVSEFAR